MGGMTTMKAEKDWAETCNQQGWNEASQIIHLEGFIREQGLFEKFAEYARVVAAEENGEASDNALAEFGEFCAIELDKDHCKDLVADAGGDADEMIAAGIRHERYDDINIFEHCAFALTSVVEHDTYKLISAMEEEDYEEAIQKVYAAYLGR